jgi:hypothetical protein
MQTVTKEQIYGRWEQIPATLKEAFFSLENADLIWKACEEAGLSEDVTNDVLTVVGNILFGFTHINDLAKELQSIPGIDTKAIDPIIFQIDKRVFEPVKVEILKLYGTVSGTEPKMVAEEMERKVIEITEQPKMVAEEKPREGIEITEQPAVLSETTQIGIRKIKIEEQPTEKLIKKEEQPMEAPSIIHSEVELKPVAQKRRGLSSFGGLFGFRQASGEKKEGPAVAAQVSMIEGIGKKPEEIAHTEQQPIRVVHYTDIKVPEDMFGSTQQTQPIMPTVPVTKQEHDFEPKVVNLTEHPATQDIFSKGEAIPAEQLTQITDNAVLPITVPAEKPQEIKSAPAEQKIVATPITVQAQTVEVPEIKEPTPQPVVSVPQPITEVIKPAEGAMPVIPQVEVMKTPQRPEAVDGVKKQEPEPRLTEIPVVDDIVDLRMLERVPDKK